MRDVFIPCEMNKPWYIGTVWCNFTIRNR